MAAVTSSRIKVDPVPQGPELVLNAYADWERLLFQLRRADSSARDARERSAGAAVPEALPLLVQPAAV